MLLRMAKAFTFYTWSPCWDKSVHGRICDELLLQPQDLCSFLSDLLLVFPMTLWEHIVMQWNCSYNSWIFISIRMSVIKYFKAFIEETVLFPIKFPACRAKFLLFRAARCLALIYLIQAFIIPKHTTAFIVHQNLTGRKLVAFVKKMCMEFASTMKLTELNQIRNPSGDFYLITCFFNPLLQIKLNQIRNPSGDFYLITCFFNPLLQITQALSLNSFGWWFQSMFLLQIWNLEDNCVKYAWELLSSMQHKIS